LYVSCYAGGRCGMACNNEDRGRGRRPDAEDRRRLHRLGTHGWAIERSGGTVCSLHRACGDEEHRVTLRVVWRSFKECPIRWS
jgi:hypothetical protein